MVARFMWPGHCPACDVLLMPEESVFCWECAERIRRSDSEDGIDGIDGIDGCDAARAMFEYGDEMRMAIVRWKYEGNSSIGHGLASLFEDDAAATLGALELEGAAQIVPVPMHSNHLRQRGFDHGYLLARALHRGASDFNTTFAPNTLTRLRDTPRQAGLGRLERAQNVAGAFAATGEVGHSVILVDDVWTTGSTLAACADALRARGARKVFAVVLARACPQLHASGPVGLA